jgi:hypothetical protein
MFGLIRRINTPKILSRLGVTMDEVLQFTVTHAPGFSVFTSILATDL